MASSGESSNNDDWVNLPDQPHPNLQATAKSQVTSAGAANGEDRGHSNSWGLWSLVSWITTSGDTSVDRKDTSVDYVPDASSDMAASASQDPRKGPSLIKKAGGAVKKIISKSRIGEPADEQWELLGHEKEEHKRAPDKDEDVFRLILREKTELQTKNSQLLRKLAEMERELKESKSQTAKSEKELHHLQKQEQRGKHHGFQRQESYEKAVISSQDSASSKDQEIRSLKRQIDKLKWEDEQCVLEISSNIEEIRQLKENIEQLRSQKSAVEIEVVNISKQAKHFEIQYHTEREHGQRLRDQIGQLQQQLEVIPLPEQNDKASSGEENSGKIIARLQGRIKMLNDNVSKLQKHSVEQSRAVLHLKQQAEMSQHMEEQVRSMEGLLEEAEREKDRCLKLLSERDTHIEVHRGTGQGGLTSVADLQAKLADKECQLRNLTDECQKWKEKTEQAEAQMLVYKGDFEEERRDRERIHCLIDDIKKKEAQIQGRAAHEKALYKQELDEVKEDLQYTKEHLHKHKTLLADTEKLNQMRVQEASKYKDEAEAARDEASKYFEEAESFRESANYWRKQAEKNQRDVQAKASQVKQYAKEIGRLKAKVDEHKKQKSGSKESMKILMDEHDKVTKELKKQNTQLLKQNEQLRKKRKPDIELLASPDSPPEEDSTLLEIEFPQQCADDADKRADEARARVIEAERRAEEAEKHAKEARLGAESRVAKLEKELDGRDVQVQNMSSEIQRLRHENQQLHLQQSQRNSKSTSQPANMIRPVPEDAQTARSGSFAHSQPSRASIPEEPAPQGELKPKVTTTTTGNPRPSHQFHLQTTSACPQSQKIAAVSSMTPPSGFSVGNHPISGSASIHFTKKSNSQSDSESETSPSVHPKDTDYNESRTTHLEKRLDRVLLDMQAIAAENEKLRAEMYQMKKQPAAAVSFRISHELHEDVLVKEDFQKHQKKLPPALNLRSHDQASPAANENRSRSPSPVAVVKPMFQKPKPQSPYRRQASVGPIMAEVLPLAQPISPTLLRVHYNQQQQQKQNIINIGDTYNPQEMDNCKTLKHEECNDRPFDPNLVCPTCKQQFRIGEIQEYKKHYKLYHSGNKKEDSDPIGHNMAGDTQPFTPIFPIAGHQVGLNEDVQTVRPKLLCRTPGCSFQGYEDLGGLCPDCSGHRNTYDGSDL